MSDLAPVLSPAPFQDEFHMKMSGIILASVQYVEEIWRLHNCVHLANTKSE